MEVVNWENKKKKIVPPAFKLLLISMSHSAQGTEAISSIKPRKKQNPPLPEELREKFTRVSIGNIAPSNVHLCVHKKILKHKQCFLFINFLKKKQFFSFLILKF